MSIFLIDKIKPINGQFPVYEDTDGYGGFQVRSNISDRDSIPELNRKEGMLVYTVLEKKLWQLGSGLTNIDWVEASFGNGSGGSGGNGTGFFPTFPGPPGTVALVDATGNVVFDFISTDNVDGEKHISGLKVTPKFGFQDIETDGYVNAKNLIADGYLKSQDGYFSGILSISGSAGSNVPLSGSGEGLIYFDSTLNNFLVSRNGQPYAELLYGNAQISSATANSEGVIKLSGDLAGQNSTSSSPRVGSINGASIPVGENLTPGNLLQVSAGNSLSYGPLNLAGGDGYITGSLPVKNGGNPVKVCEFNFTAGVATTNETVFQNIGSIMLDTSKIMQPSAGETRTLKLRVVMHTTNPDIPGEVMLYDHSGGRVINLQNTNPDPLKAITMETNSVYPAVLESEDLSSFITTPPYQNSLYEVRVRQKSQGSSPNDQIICQMCKLYVEWF